MDKKRMIVRTGHALPEANVRQETGKRYTSDKVLRTVVALTVGMMLVPVASCSKRATTVSAESAPVSEKAPSDPQPILFDVCTIFSAADAARILGMPVSQYINHYRLGMSACAYGGKPSGNKSWQQMPSVILSVAKYQTAADEASAWEDQKVLHSLHQGRQNLTVVNGSGSEAYFENIPLENTINGIKVAEKWVEAKVIVHKERSHFWLSQTTDRGPSPEALKAVAQKVAAELP